MTKTQILVVEDNNIVAMELRDRLQAIGYPVLAITAYAEQAVETAGKTRPDLVLMDIRLRGEMDGIQAAEAIRTRFDIPVVYVTANADEPTLQRAKQTEPYGFIIKPFQERELHTTIQMALYKHKMERRLRERERWSATTLRSINDGVITTDRQGVVEYMNPAAEELTGWQQEEAVGRDVAKVFPVASENSEEDICVLADNTIEDGVTVSQQIHSLTARNGMSLPVESSLSPIRDENGAISGIVLAFHDITIRKQAEDALLQGNHELTTLLNLSMALADQLNVNDLPYEITRFVTDTLPSAEAATLWLYDGVRKKMALHAWTGHDSTDVEGLVVSSEIGLIGLVSRSGQPYNAGDVTCGPSYVPAEHRVLSRARSVLLVPMSTDRRLIGVLCAENFSRPHAFGTRDERLLQSMAGQAVVAIDRARLLDTVTSHQRDLQRLSSQLVRVQEAERKRISQELHDEIGQALTAVGINLGVLKRALWSELEEENRERFDEAMDLTNHTLEQMRELSIELRPPMLDDLGLIPTLRWYANRFANRLVIDVKVEVSNLEGPLNAELETTLYRVVQEALTNIARHAQATNVRLRLAGGSSAVDLYVEDDGVGFDMTQVRKPGATNYGMGLFGMRERVLFMGGQFEIRSQPGHGTRLYIQVPLQCSMAMTRGGQSKSAAKAILTSSKHRQTIHSTRVGA